MSKKEEIIQYFRELFCKTHRGFEGFITENTHPIILERLERIEEGPLTYVQLNQLFAFANIPAISDDFYKYYWINKSVSHTYDVAKLPEFSQINFVGSNISSLPHLKWGLQRIVIDCLLYFGNINSGFMYLHNKNSQDLTSFFVSKRYDTELIASRGEPLDFKRIDKEDRYLISEMACKTYDNKNPTVLVDFLIASYREAKKRGVLQPKIRHLLEEKYIPSPVNADQIELSTTDILEDTIENEDDIRTKYEKIAQRFYNARQAAIYNTSLFLSLVHDLDVYMATSMRTKNDFIQMANTCERIFSDNKIKSLRIRYFDPTISAAEGHEDKGLIECLMVKCCKVLVYSAGERESYGKDAEAAMALSLGKPVIFLCENAQKQDFFKNIHPLSRLIDFNTGVANGAIIAQDPFQVVELLRRIFTNDMQYEVKQKREGYYILSEKETGSIVRLQTNDKFLSNSFWNYYRNFR
jgi:hypothetical protein